MRYCTNCGSAVPENAQHCPRCGNSLSRRKLSPIPFFFIGFIFLIASGILLRNYLKDRSLSFSQSTAIPSGETAEVPTQELLSTRNNPTQRVPTKTAMLPTKTVVANLTPTPTMESLENDSTVDQYAKISREVGEVNLRRSPGYVNKKDRDDVIVKIPSGATVKLLEGPQKTDGLNWWYVEWNGYKGWIAERTGSGRTIMIFNP